MTELDREAQRRFEARAKALFRREEQTLDASTRERLHEARKRAVEVARARQHAPASNAGPWRVRWLAPAAAAAVIAALVLALPERGSEELPARAAQLEQIEPTDLEVLLAAESWSLYEELEFYAALDHLDDDLDSGSG